MKVKLLDTGKDLTLSDQVFACEPNAAVIHQAVTAEIAASHQGTKAQKTRAQVRGGGKKPWRQKGTGRARVGSSNNPVWRGGGVTFAASPHTPAKKINRKMYKLALRSVLSGLVKDKRLEVVSDLAVKAPKTKELVGLLQQHKLDHRAARINLVVAKLDDNLLYAARNLSGVRVLDAAAASPALLVAADKSLFTKDACAALSKGLEE